MTAAQEPGEHTPADDRPSDDGPAPTRQKEPGEHTPAEERPPHEAPASTRQADDPSGKNDNPESSKWLRDPKGSKGVILGLLGIAATAFFGLPGLVQFVHDETRTSRTVDTRWHRAGTLPTSEAWATPTAVAYAAGMWVAVGSIGTDPDTRPAAWYSSDGQHWQLGKVEMDSTVDTTEATINAITYAQGKWVAAGDATAFGGIGAAIWISSDGVSWQRDRSSDTALGGTGTQQMNAIATGPDGLVAVGYEDFGGDASGAIWRSSDAVHWTRVDDPSSELGGPGDQDIATLAIKSGRWIAAGKDEPTAYSSRAAVWTSLDGATWTRDRTAPELTVPGTAAIFGVSMFKGEVVAVGATSESGDKDGQVWTSGDGASWTRISDDVSIFGGGQDQDMFGVASAGNELIAVGTDQSSGEYDPAVWSSNDAAHWKRVLNDNVFDYSRRTQLTAVAEHDGDVVAVGTADDGVGQSANTWYRTAKR